MAQRRLAGLQRVLGVNALFSTAYGNVGSSIYYALGLVASYALGLTPIVFFITGGVFYLTAATYAEATAMYPEAGGSSSFARHAFNEFWSFFAAWAQMLNYVITVSISAFFVPHYLGGLFWAPLRHSPADVLFAIGVIAVLCIVNVRGVKESAGVNILLAVTDFATQLLLVTLGMVLVFSPSTLANNIHFGVAPSARGFLVAIPLGMIAYTGIETISNMAEEARDEAKTIPAAIKRVVLAVFAIYALLPAVALSALPVKQTSPGHYSTLLGVSEAQGGFAGDPVLGVVKHLHLGALQGPGEIYVGLLAATILFIATNAGIIGVSRLVYSMGLHRQLPDQLRRLHPRYGTPWIGIFVFGAIACLTVIPGQASFLGNMYAFGAMLSFTIAHAAVVRLRVTQPNHTRPYRGPGTIRIAGRALPLFALVGGLGTGLAFVGVVTLYIGVALAGVGWLALGVVVFVVYRRRQGLDLTSTVKIELPSPATDHEVEYQSVLVALEAGSHDTVALSTAARLASRRRRAIYVLVLIEVPASLAIDAPMPAQEDLANTTIEEARLRIGSRATGRWQKVRPRQAARVILSAAREAKVEAIVMPISSASGFNDTVQTVLRERPCRVILAHAPTPALAASTSTAAR
jgi:APA family basic amino acid/polyamine antiporter